MSMSRRNDGSRRDLVAELDEHVNEERQRIAQLTADVAAVKQQLIEAKDKMKEMSDSLATLVGIFQQSKGAITLIKWMSALAVGGAAVWAWIVTNFNVHIR